MEEFDQLLRQAVSIKSSESAAKRKIFDSLPLFIKCGLFYYEKYANVRKQAFLPRYNTCEMLKAEGNRLFSQAIYEKATRTYEQALSIFRYITSRKPNWKNEGICDDDLDQVAFVSPSQSENERVKAISLSLYLNLAASYLKISDYSNARASCDEALKIDKANTKALFRRARARTMPINSEEADYEAALKDLSKAAELDPKDEMIIHELKRTKAELDKYRQQKSSLCKGIFTKAAPIVVDPPKKAAEVQEKRQENEAPKSSITQEKTQPKPKERAKEVPKETPKTAKKLEPPLKETQELGQYLEQRGMEIVQLYESCGKHKEAAELKDKLSKVLMARRQLASMSGLDFDNPNEKLQETARRFGLNLEDSATRLEIKRMQEENIRQIKELIKEREEDLQPKVTKSESSSDSSRKSSMDEKLKDDKKGISKDLIERLEGKSVVINNNFINSTINADTTNVTNYLSQTQHKYSASESNKLLADFLSSFNKMSTENATNQSKLSRIMNLVILILAIVLFLLTIILQSWNVSTPKSL
eukprot:TRINITY_DN3046_c0_g1_i10.p1 TRINITY_DN3046_c0_g1~~TRINITY_DN3046_c0_g1_i10.p1  ORF type:complete len:532 (-),score=111.04 TRINITY_DN3046_c0_g1_i10:174-1769(-)